MEILNITDDQIKDLLSMPKSITNPGARWKELGRTKLKDYSVLSDDGAYKFAVFVRQSTRLINSFSAGLLWHNGEDNLVLMRCNGSSHVHGNKLEREVIRMAPHIHIATARYISIGKKSEGFAEETSAYNSVDGALAVLFQRCNIRDPRHQSPASPSYSMTNVEAVQKAICSSLCADVEVISQGDGLLFVSTPFFFPDGDAYSIYLEPLQTGGFA